MYGTYLILGGAGLVGTQVCRELARHGARQIVVGSLTRAESEGACEALSSEFPETAWVPTWGNLFVPADLADRSRSELLADAGLRRRLLDFLYGDFEMSYASNHLVQTILRYQPEGIVDCVNTATGFSYQDVFDGAAKVLEWMAPDGYSPDGVPDLEAFLLSQSTPQLILHVRMLHRATVQAGTRVYLKVGTTGTGGMGLNIPYTHSEDKPSKVLLAKNEAGFGHTGLLFLLARTPGGPVVKEIKPAAMIGYRAVKQSVVRDRYGSDRLVEPKLDAAAGELDLRQDTAGYVDIGQHAVAVVDTGENGVFTRGEFAAITALGQMEYITPEEIARVIALELRGANTGQDVISAIDSSVLNPSYKAGLLRTVAMRDLMQADEGARWPSIALGRLGPPELSKLLFEAHLLKEAFGTLEGVLGPTHQPRSPESLSAAVAARVEESPVRHLAPSIGIPILLPDGETILRGPRINVPELVGHRTRVTLSPEARDHAAGKGWIDLRPSNLARWRDRIGRMLAGRRHLRDAGSAAASLDAYLPVDLEIGEVVAWIFNNEMGGHRIK